MALPRFPTRRAGNVVPLLLAIVLGIAALLAFLIPGSDPAVAEDAARNEKTEAPKAAQAQAQAKEVDSAAARKEPTAFIRIKEKPGEESMDTAVVSYVDAGGTKVHLVGAIHIADAAYYEKLNKLFDTYDALLYELVGDPERLTRKDGEENKEEKKGSGLSFLGYMQKSAGRLLELEFQLPSIDYTKDHFVHADMSLEEFDKAREKRKESFLTFIIKSIQADLKAKSAGKGSDDISLFEIIKAFAADDSALRFKRMVAQQFKSAEFTTQLMEKDGGTTIITDRNKVAFAVLKKSIAAGRKNIGVFYGAAHMQDLEGRLLESGFKRTGVEWLTAWDMKTQKVEKKAAGEKKNSE